MQTVFSRYEISNTRILVLSGVLVATLCFAVFFLVTENKRLMQLVEYQDSHKIMIGYPSEDGTFASVVKLPEPIVIRYIKGAVNNVYNYDIKSIGENYREVIEQYDYRVRDRIEPKLLAIANALEEGVSQSLTIRKQRLEEKDDHYVVRFLGRVRQYVGNLLADEYDVEITTHIAKIAPTKSRPEGLSILNISDTHSVKER
jgi:hypothetical protein